MDKLFLVAEFDELGGALLAHLAVKREDKGRLLGRQQASLEETREVVHGGTCRQENDDLLLAVAAQKSHKSAELFCRFYNLRKTRRPNNRKPEKTSVGKETLSSHHG